MDAQDIVVTEAGPRKECQAEVYRCRIQGIHTLCKIDSELLVAVEVSCFGNEKLSEVGVDSPVSCLVCVGKGISCDP